MSLKSFSFGLGLGIAFVSILSIILVKAEVDKFKNENKVAEAQMSDEAVIARAKELGMVTLGDLPNKRAGEQTTVVQKPVEQATEEIAEVTTAETIEDTTQEIAQADDYEAGSTTITIVGGTTARVVSEELMKKGVIDSAEDFRRYLTNTGYSTKISVGTFEIPNDATYDEIIEIIKDKRG